MGTKLEGLSHYGGLEKGVDRGAPGLFPTAGPRDTLHRTLSAWRVFYLLFWKLCKNTALWAELAAGVSHSPLSTARALLPVCPFEKHCLRKTQDACSASVGCDWPPNWLCSNTQYLEPRLPRLPSSSSADQRLSEGSL